MGKQAAIIAKAKSKKAEAAQASEAIDGEDAGLCCLKCKEPTTINDS